MLELNFFVIAVFVLLSLFALLFWAISPSLQQWQALQSIPGPKQDLLTGNLNDLADDPDVQLRDWATQYGELFTVRLGLENVVYVNSREAVREIFDKRAAATSCKGPMIGANEIVHGKRLAILPYGPRWRDLRALVHKILTPKMVNKLEPSQDFESKQLLYDLLKHNADDAAFFDHMRRYTISIMMTAIYGIRVPTSNTKIQADVMKIMEDFSITTDPAAFITNLVPQLAYLPAWLQWWRPKAMAFYQRQHDTWMSLWSDLENKHHQKRAPPCFAHDLMIHKDNRSSSLDTVEAAFLAGTMIEAGMETTASALQTLVLYLMKHPDIQQQAADEVLSAVQGRLPEFEDVDQLPYIRACVKEVFRIAPLLRFGAFHYTTSDVEYKAHTIPKNTYISLNVSALHFDETHFTNPYEFEPARYLAYSKTSTDYANTAERDQYNFGSGRRICPGINLAEHNLCMVLARLLWSFEIVDMSATGKISEADFEPGANRVPKPFKARFIARSECQERVVQTQWAQAKAEGYVIGGQHINVDGVVVAA